MITSKPRFGEKIPVNTPTTIHALLEFENGAVVTLNTSWDVWKHGHAPIELYGEEGTLFVPDPNFFGGQVAYTKQGDAVKKLPKWEHPLAVPNQQHAQGMLANYRTAGLADMAIAIAEGRPHRCSMEAALHAIEVMTGILKSGETGKFVAMQTTCERPAALGDSRGQGAARQEGWQKARQEIEWKRSAPSRRRSFSWRRIDGLAPGRQPLRHDDLQPLRPFGAQAAGDVARPLAQFRRGHAASAEARALPQGVRRSASRISISPTITARRPDRPKRRSARSCRTDFAGYRDELIISTKAGYGMWPGPYGEWGSRKYLLASLDQSLKRLGLDYVDIFYSHRFDPDTPLEETMMALDHAVRSGKALYAGISSYNSQRTREAATILRELGTPLAIHQPSYSMINRWVEDDGLLDTLEGLGVGSIAFTPLAQGMLTDKYLRGIPETSRAAQGKSLRQSFLDEDTIANIRALNEIAGRRGQTLAQMALAWVLRKGRITTALIGASRPEQIEDCVGALEKRDFTDAELAEIDKYALDAGVNLWAASSERQGPVRK